MNWSSVAFDSVSVGSDQHRAVHHQREVHGHRVIALVDQALGEIERGEAAARSPCR
jgi:hypothetical protein